MTVAYTTSIYKNNKLYVYEPVDIDLMWSGVNIYNLKDGPISDIKPLTINFTNSNPVYTPQFLQLPRRLPNGRSDQLWMIGGLYEQDMKENDIDQETWTCQIVNDNEFKFDSSFIPMAPFKNFPKSGFSQTIVDINNNPILYILGGYIYSKDLDNQVLTNYLFKYEFNGKKWSDLSESTKSIIPPTAFHRVIEVDNSLIVVGGVSSNFTLNGNFTHTVPSTNEIDYSNINIVYKFDLNSQKWSSIHTKLNKDAETYYNGTVAGPSLNLYNGKITSYMSLYNYIDQKYEPQIAILDHETWEWEWHQVKNDAGTDNNLALSFHQTLVINDQLLLIHGITNQQNNKQLYSIDLKTYLLVGTLNVSGNYDDTNTSSGLPAWAIIIIVVVCIIAVILLIIATWLYFRYKNRSKAGGKRDQKMQEVWAVPDHEKGETSAAGAMAFSNTGTSNNITGSTANDEAMLNYDYFQHEIDLQDMTENNNSSKLQLQ